MTPSDACVNLVKQFEGLRLEAYLDTGGVPTIGYGHTLHVQMGDLISEDQADAFLESDLKTAAFRVEAACTIAPNQNQFDALTSFEYNTGALEHSTLLHLWNTGAPIQETADEFLLWTHGRIDGKLVTLPGLVKRRTAERALFLGVSA